MSSKRITFILKLRHFGRKIFNTSSSSFESISETTSKPSSETSSESSSKTSPIPAVCDNYSEYGCLIFASTPNGGFLMKKSFYSEKKFQASSKRSGLEMRETYYVNVYLRDQTISVYVDVELKFETINNKNIFSQLYLAPFKGRAGYYDVEVRILS
ncbi:hypothetical protein AYI69_g681 [Smittium culicis]|uniref:Uncharacterized protein n=1 Tax=Smittium culicis TaxID=133412 RepID=A0A1R1YSC3_9FUNG|nr:hypothetical protein AYI69_g681 [Smittium culicis]